MEESLLNVRLQRLQHLQQLLQQKRELEEGGGVKRLAWREVARPEQLAPEGDFFLWLLLAGRLRRIRKNASRV